VRDRVLVHGPGGLDVPEDPAGLGVDREQVRVDGPEVQRVAENRESAAHAPAARTGVHAGTILRRPIRTAGDAVERDDLIDAPDGWSLHGVQHAVDGQRRGFEFLERPGLPDPLQLEILDVRRCDLRQLTVSLVLDRAGVGEPVLRLFVGAHDAVEGDILRQQRDAEHGNRDERREMLHGLACPFNDMR
jgi:hypothetical protein